MSVEAQPGETHTVNIALQPLLASKPPTPRGTKVPTPQTTKWPSVAMWTGITTGVVTGLGSFALILFARLEFADVEAKRGQPLESLENIRAQRDRGVVLQNAGIVFALLAVAGGVVSVVAGMQIKPAKKPQPLSDDPASGRVMLFSTHAEQWVRHR